MFEALLQTLSIRAYHPSLGIFFMDLVLGSNALKLTRGGPRILPLMIPPPVRPMQVHCPWLVKLSVNIHSNNITHT